MHTGAVVETDSRCADNLLRSDVRNGRADSGDVSGDE